MCSTWRTTVGGPTLQIARGSSFGFIRADDPSIGLEMGTLVIPGKILKEEVFAPTIGESRRSPGAGRTTKELKMIQIGRASCRERVS